METSQIRHRGHRNLCAVFLSGRLILRNLASILKISFYTDGCKAVRNFTFFRWYNYIVYFKLNYDIRRLYVKCNSYRTFGKR